MNRVAIIVLNWNGIEDTMACLPSLLAQTYPNYTVVVVDNGSTDNSLEVLEPFISEHQDKLHLIKNQRNEGFAGGVNTGIRWALEQSYNAIALFNNDAVAEPTWLAELASTLDTQPDVGIATGLLLHTDGKTIDSTGDWYSIWGLPFPRSRGEHTVHAPASGLTFGASGGATLYRSDVFKTIGLFDETFFAYYEDVDVSFRAQLAGFTVAYNADAIAYHKQGATSAKIPGFTVVQTFKNLPILFWKNVPLRLFPLVAPRFLLAYVLIYGNSYTHRSGWSATKGLFHSLGLLPHALRERRRIQASKQVGDNYIKSLLWPDLPPDQTGLRKFRSLFTKHS